MLLICIEQLVYVRTTYSRATRCVTKHITSVVPAFNLCSSVQNDTRSILSNCIAHYHVRQWHKLLANNFYAPVRRLVRTTVKQHGHAAMLNFLQNLVFVSKNWKKHGTRLNYWKKPISLKHQHLHNCLMKHDNCLQFSRHAQGTSKSGNYPCAFSP